MPSLNLIFYFPVNILSIWVEQIIVSISVGSLKYRTPPEVFFRYKQLSNTGEWGVRNSWEEKMQGDAAGHELEIIKWRPTTLTISSLRIIIICIWF